MSAIIIRGPLGVGKSTVAKAVAEKIGGFYISVDEVLDQNDLDKAVEGEGIPLSNFLKANEIIAAEAKQAKGQRKPVVVDGNFYHKEQIEQLVRLLGDATTFTLKASVETCVARDAVRAKPYGEDAARAVHIFVSAFDYGTVIDTGMQTIKETIQSVMDSLDSQPTTMGTLTFGELANKITNLPFKYRQRLIAIDGGGGAGKTTFANRLQKEIPGSCIVRVDDFYLPPQLRTPVLSMDVINPNFDWDRIRKLVIDAVKDDKDISYQLYDFKNGTLTGEVIRVPRDATIILEGVWSMQEAVIDFYDYRIWLEAPANLRLERGVSRDGEELRQVWVDEWIPIDESYKKIQAPYLRADIIVDSARSDFEKDCIVLSAL